MAADKLGVKVWDEITYPFPNFNGTAVNVWDEITYPFPNFNGCVHLTLYNGCHYLSMLGLKLIHVSKRGP